MTAVSFKYSSELKDMLKKACTFQYTFSYVPVKPKPIKVEREINGLHVVAIGSMVERNTLDGWVCVPCVRWELDGVKVSKQLILSLFGVRSDKQP